MIHPPNVLAPETLDERTSTSIPANVRLPDAERKARAARMGCVSGLFFLGFVVAMSFYTGAEWESLHPVPPPTPVPVLRCPPTTTLAVTYDHGVIEVRCANALR